MSDMGHSPQSGLSRTVSGDDSRCNGRGFEEPGNAGRASHRRCYSTVAEQRRAFSVEPKLLTLSGIGPDFTRNQDFPLLSDEDRFKELMKK
jgi:hypothetical protein